MGREGNSAGRASRAFNPKGHLVDADVLAAELHDRVITALTALLVEMERFKHEQYNRAGVRAAVADFQATTRAALAQLREVVHGIQGVHLPTTAAFAEAIRLGPLAEVERQLGATITLEVAPDWPPALDQFVAGQLFRIVEHALRNIVDHSQARTVEVRLELSGDELLVTVADDGQGRGWSQQGRGQGITGMEHRALILGGTLDVKERAPHGLIVQARVPWQ